VATESRMSKTAQMTSAVAQSRRPFSIPSTGNAGQAHPHDTFAVVQRVIAEVTGNEYEDITLDADLEEDLGIDMMSEFPAIVLKIKKEVPEIVIPTSRFIECATVAELVELIDDERDL
jgi:acyl carrier protein